MDSDGCYSTIQPPRDNQVIGRPQVGTDSLQFQLPECHASDNEVPLEWELVSSRRDIFEILTKAITWLDDQKGRTP